MFYVLFYRQVQLMIGILGFFFFIGCPLIAAESSMKVKNADEWLDNTLKPVADWCQSWVFFEMPVGGKEVLVKCQDVTIYRKILGNRALTEKIQLKNGELLDLRVSELKEVMETSLNQQALAFDPKTLRGLMMINGVNYEVSIVPQRAFFVIYWLIFAGAFLTLWFKFVNLTSFGIALKTILMRYTAKDDPGEITHFQAICTALSGTVGLGNIAGVAIGISVGGPGAAFWMFVAGFLGMTTKFCECTLGLRYREFDAKGRVYGGSFYTLKHGLSEIGLGGLGKILAVAFAFFCVGGAFGGGNMFQVNQTFQQLVQISGGTASFWYGKGWLFGTLISIITAMTIIGGIKSIARVTDFLTPFMCLGYILCALYVIFSKAGQLPEAFAVIFKSAFDWGAVGGGALTAMIWGFRRAAFSNEAGFGSSPIAHSAVRTRYPASEGYVALLEPFLDTVVVCTLTALALVVTGVYEGGAAGGGTSAGIALTNAAFTSAGSFLPYCLFLFVLCFAVSTIVSWSYYGQQAWAYLFGRSLIVENIYKFLFCLFIILGAGSKVDSVVDFSDAMMFAMCFPNLIGIYLLLPKIEEEIVKYKKHRQQVDQNLS
jgi:AGCS family alanine or glycine:cation symporter